MGCLTFMCLLNPNFMQKNKNKKVMSQCWENGVENGPTGGQS